MGLPRPNFSRLRHVRIPERLRNVHVPARLRHVLPAGLTSRIGFPQGLSAAGGLTLPYKLAVVAVMMLVTGGTLVTFGSAGAETAGKPGTVSAVGAVAAASGSVLPGTSEVVPKVEGQILPETTYDYTPDTSILSANDLLSNLKLTDYSPKSKSDDKKDDDKKSDDKKNDDKKTTATSKTNSGSKTDPKTDKPKTDDPKTDDPKTDNGDGDGKTDNGDGDKGDGDNGDKGDGDNGDGDKGDGDKGDDGDKKDRKVCKNKILRPKNCD